MKSGISEYQTAYKTYCELFLRGTEILGPVCAISGISEYQTAYKTYCELFLRGTEILYVRFPVYSMCEFRYNNRVRYKSNWLYCIIGCVDRWGTACQKENHRVFCDLTQMPKACGEASKRYLYSSHGSCGFGSGSGCSELFFESSGVL